MQRQCCQKLERDSTKGGVCVITDGQTILTASVGHIYNQMCHSFDKLEVVVACFEYIARDDAADKRSRRLSVPPLV